MTVHGYTLTITTPSSLSLVGLYQGSRPSDAVTCVLDVWKVKDGDTSGDSVDFSICELQARSSESSSVGAYLPAGTYWLRPFVEDCGWYSYPDAINPTTPSQGSTRLECRFHASDDPTQVPVYAVMVGPVGGGLAPLAGSVSVASTSSKAAFTRA